MRLVSTQLKMGKAKEGDPCFSRQINKNNNAIVMECQHSFDGSNKIIKQPM
jgi:hypothetical protein